MDMKLDHNAENAPQPTALGPKCGNSCCRALESAVALDKKLRLVESLRLHCQSEDWAGAADCARELAEVDRDLLALSSPPALGSQGPSLGGPFPR